MICPDCQENRYHHHSNLRPIEREKPMNIVEEAIKKHSYHCVDCSRKAIEFVVRKCAELAKAHKGRTAEEMHSGHWNFDDLFYSYENQPSWIADEILRAAGLEEKGPRDASP